MNRPRKAEKNPIFRRHMTRDHPLPDRRSKHGSLRQFLLSSASTSDANGYPSYLVTADGEIADLHSRQGDHR